MKCFCYLLFALISLRAIAQDIKIKPGFKVRYSNIHCTYNGKQEVHLGMEDHMEGDTLKFYIATPGYDVNAVELNFIKGKVIAKYYNWSDSGLGITKSDFKELELVLNGTKFKLGDTIKGKIKAVGFLDRGSGQTYEFKGNFRHIVENTPEKRKRELKERIKRQSQRLYTPTGFYTTVSDHDAKNYNLPPYIMSGANYYLYVEEPHFGLYKFSGVTRSFDPKTLNLTLKFKIRKDHLEDMHRETDFWIPIGFVLDDVLMQVFAPVTLDKEDNLIVTLKAKDKKEADRIISTLQRQIRSAKAQ